MSREWGLPIDPLLACTGSAPTGPSPTPAPRLLFVGNSRGVYRYAVRSALADRAPTDPARQRLDGVRPPRPHPPGGVANEEVGELYASAGVVAWNDHHLDMRRDSFASNRLFDAAACGTRVLSDRIDGIEETFDGLVVPFDNKHELARR